MRKLLLIFMLATSLGCSLANALQDTTLAKYVALPLRSNSESFRDNALTTTTERPIIRYWNSLMERVRMPWVNMTNPLVNLFNNGNANIIETPITEYQTENLTPKRRRKMTNKRKTYNRHRYQNDDVAYATQEYYAQQGLVPAQPARKIYYFYDPHMRRYYGVQTVQPNNYYEAPYGNKQQLYYYDDSYQNYYQPHRRPTKQQHKKRLTTTAPITEDTAEDSGEASEAEDQVLMVPAEEQTEMATSADQELIQDDYVPADGVEVVENFDNDSEEYRQVDNESPAMEYAKDEEELLRNMLGSYMSDDPLSRKRQQAHNKQSNSKAKQGPRLKFYLLGRLQGK